MLLQLSLFRPSHHQMLLVRMSQLIGFSNKHENVKLEFLNHTLLLLATATHNQCLNFQKNLQNKKFC